MSDAEVRRKITHYLEERGMTQAELARRLKISTVTVNRWMKDKVEISPAYRRILQQEGIL